MVLVGEVAGWVGTQSPWIGVAILFLFHTERSVNDVTNVKVETEIRIARLPRRRVHVNV